jgi:hypothetical protein
VLRADVNAGGAGVVVVDNEAREDVAAGAHVQVLSGR